MDSPRDCHQTSRLTLFLVQVIPWILVWRVPHLLLRNLFWQSWENPILQRSHVMKSHVECLQLIKADGAVLILWVKFAGEQHGAKKTKKLHKLFILSCDTLLQNKLKTHMFPRVVFPLSPYRCLQYLLLVYHCITCQVQAPAFGDLLVK